MTRSTDRFVSLAGRVEIANRSNADLFLSIHANANRVRGLNGFEVYYIGRRANDAQRALSSARSESLNLGGSSLAGSSLDLKATLWDMVYTNNRAASLDLAGDLCRAMERNLNAQILGIKEAGFYVLKGAHMPAVLAEVGFVSNGEEERQLRNDYYRQQIAQALEQGIVAYAQDLSLAEANRQ
jgi:N-acetylmuramoyl-L-alanine amidase